MIFTFLLLNSHAKNHTGAHKPQVHNVISAWSPCRKPPVLIVLAIAANGSGGELVALPPFAQLDALIERLARPLSTTDNARAVAILGDVSAEIRAESGRSWTTPAGELDPDRPPMLAVICLKAAERAMRNPTGLHAESMGDYRRTFADQQQPAGVYLTEGEVDLLRRLAGADGIVSVPVEREVTITDTVYLSDQFGGDKIPWEVPFL